MVVYVDDHVRVEYRGTLPYLNFTGIITGTVLGGYIIKPDVMTKEIAQLRNPRLDPEGCIVMHGSYIKEKIA